MATCFACDAPVPPLPGLAARLACADCKSRARLILGGASLAAVLASSRPEPLEGSALGPLLNPLDLDGRRAWALFAAGGWAVAEEIHPSDDWFDFTVQHAADWPRLRATLRAAREATPARVVLEAVLAGQTGPLTLGRLVGWWSAAAQARRILAGHGPILTNADAWAAAEALAPGDLDAASRIACVERLLVLAGGESGIPG